MTIENKIRALAGTLILISLVLSQFHSHYWLLLTAFVGINLVQSSFTKFCLPEIVLKKLHQKSDC